MRHAHLEERLPDALQRQIERHLRVERPLQSRRPGRPLHIRGHLIQLSLRLRVRGAGPSEPEEPLRVPICGRRGRRAGSATEHFMRVMARDARVHVPAEGFHDRDAGGDVADVDFEDPRHGIRDPDPGQIVRLDLPRRRHARYRDPARDDAQAHQEA